MTKQRRRVLAAAVVAAGAIPIGYGVLEATRPPSFEPSTSDGDLERGRIHTELYRGASVPDEVVVMALPNDCKSHLDLDIKWDKKKNKVEVHLKGKRALDPNPVQLRTEGVDYFPNAFWPEAKDVVNGRYLLWIITVPGLTSFYYDHLTLELLGTEYDFETPPEDAIEIRIPAFVAVPTDFIDVKPNGDVDFRHTFEYDGLVRGDLPQYSHFVASFVPQTLCKAHPYDYTQTSSRPYASPTLPASAALPFSEYLENGLIFDITVEPPEYHTFPPISTNVVTYS